MSTQLTIRRAIEQDLPQLASLSAQTFHDAFAHLNHAQDVQDHISGTYSESNLFNEMQAPGSVFYLGEINRQPVSYLKLNTGSSQAEFQRPDELEIQRLYVASAYQGQKIGEQLIRFAIGEAQNRNCCALWLGVWEHNVNAIRFYERHGFTVFSHHDFLLGTDLQTDLLMKLTIR